MRRKIEGNIEEYLRSFSNKMMVVEGARQVGKSYTIRKVGKRLFKNYIEINMEHDKQHYRLFAEAKTEEAFYMALSSVAGKRMGKREDTLVFIDEIQAYDHLFTLVKFLMQDGRFTYIASGSLLGVTLSKTQSVPVGSLIMQSMCPLDFEEFLWANEVGTDVIDEMRCCFKRNEPLPEAIHNRTMDLFRRYLLVGGMPDAVKTYVVEHNIAKVRQVQQGIMQMYIADAVKYEQESSRKLKIRRIYDMIPSNMGNHKKRIRVKDIEDKVGKRTSDYQDEFDYLVSSGIALEVDAISQPTFPLSQNAGKNLLKLYLNDVGLLTGIFYRNNIKPVLEDISSINLGAVYETVVAQELYAHGFNLYYYDNKKNGEVDFLIDDHTALSSLPIEVKSGKDYTVHSALDKFIATPDYNVHAAYVLNSDKGVRQTDSVTYAPIYNIMFFEATENLPEEDLFF